MTEQLVDRRSLPIFIHSVIDDMTALTPNAMRVYMHLARRANKSGAAWPSYQSIGDHCFSSVSENAATRKSFARRAIDDLITARLIAKEARRREDGSPTSNVYILQDPVPIGTGMPNKHTPMPNKHTPMPNKHTLCLIGTEGTPTEDTPLEGNPRQQPSSSSFATIVKAYESEIGLLTPLIADELKSTIDEYPEEWITSAIRIAAEANKRSWRYVHGVLKRSKAEGHPPGVRTEDAESTVEERRKKYIPDEYADIIIG